MFSFWLELVIYLERYSSVMCEKLRIKSKFPHCVNTIQYNLFYVGNVGGGYPIPRA